VIVLGVLGQKMGPSISLPPKAILDLKGEGGIENLYFSSQDFILNTIDNLRFFVLFVKNLFC